MGANDRNPTGSATLQPKWKSGPKSTVYWTDVPDDVIIGIVKAASNVGAYVGFGSSTDATALLLYVKNGRVNERIPLENLEEATEFGKWVIAHWLQP